jgi:hypothetical protein
MTSSPRDREQALRAYDDESLKTAYKIAARLPMNNAVTGKTREQMIAFILDAERRRPGSL